MKLNKFIYIASLFALVAISACKKSIDFIADNTTPAGSGSYPISSNTFTDIATKTAIPVTAGYTKGQNLSWEIQYFSQSPIKELNLYETIGTGTRNKIKNYPYQAAYSKTKATDTLIINYQVPATATSGSSVKVETEILNQNTLNLIRTFTYKVK